MGTHEITADKRQAGFTLVELAVVMIIIGLLIGGVLKGQELIANAQITGTASAVKSIDAATTTFRDTYAALPGDITNPAARLPNCVGVCNNPGDGNTRIDTDAVDAGMTANGENHVFWSHLAAADLITGIDPNLGVAFGGDYPSAPIAGGFHAGFDSTGVLGENPQSRTGHYLVLHDNAGGAPAGTALSALQAARIDRKLDDGAPTSGTVFESVAGCDDGGAPAVYDEANGGAVCDLFLRFQN
ncbi:MAG: prepilin-type N-terminal cleavage/methylation domain-containing protein [Rhodospirillales bacterium]|nr:prepilin-type N-terminal cleavage/methylation domain-containing protein [Rhodospirillales bacterium]